tara:strand:+ start:231 stop:356 length:126 start_codon:yes stop_codon:yes gene_type:complete
MLAIPETDGHLWATKLTKDLIVFEPTNKDKNNYNSFKRKLS